MQMYSIEEHLVRNKGIDTQIAQSLMVIQICKDSVNN